MDFADFFRTEADQLLRFCWMLTLDADEAADLAQTAMERVYERWDELQKPGQNPAGWVRTVAVNLSRSRWRRLKRYAALVPKVAPSSVVEDAVASDPDLAAAVSGLAPRQRQVVALRYWSDMSLRDCATTMGISVGSAKQHLTRAHRHLASVLDPASVEELVL